MRENSTQVSKMHQLLLKLAAQEAHTEKTENLGHLLPPKQVAELLLWYMQWSHDLAAEMHRSLVQNQVHHTIPSSFPCDCGCDSEWQCEPHDACFIHDSYFCPGSGTFPPVKPPHT